MPAWRFSFANCFNVGLYGRCSTKFLTIGILLMVVSMLLFTGKMVCCCYLFNHPGPLGHPSVGGELAALCLSVTIQKYKSNENKVVMIMEGSNSPPLEGCPKGGVVISYWYYFTATSQHMPEVASFILLIFLTVNKKPNIAALFTLASMGSSSLCSNNI